MMISRKATTTRPVRRVPGDVGRPIWAMFSAPVRP